MTQWVLEVGLQYNHPHIGSAKFGTKTDIQTFLPISKELQRYITSWNALTQLCIILTVFQKCETRPGIINIQSGSDSTGAVANIYHGFSTTDLLADIIKLVSIKQNHCNTLRNVHHIHGEKNIDADNLSRGKLSSFPDELRVDFDLNVIFDRTPFPRYINKLVQWDPEIQPLAKYGDSFSVVLCCFLNNHSSLFFLLFSSRSFLKTCVITAAPIYQAQCSPVPLWSGFSIGRHRPYH